eukprot:CAMPEP_0177292872 /NCGR_PEP_ID=MMETSP0368-20130122/430_1 /TAXON_ID=447022 ORGANISM="Scrippsiella hangoei-like, Strain SHHI-4" /NCGR_SAMPLE_ID=MMETSP0368 /ASSEMBLY_ACC=CAM_ASM_000363 /LENGTH=211 /DNA_ID=CAMNT_0018750579 /DNA_START=75 /DNA_END=709 /DNA_ORIENTATION=-
MASIRGSNATACGSASAARRPPLRSSRASLYVTRHKYSLIFIRTTSDLQLPTGKSISAHHAQLLGLRRRSWRRPSTNSAITGSRIYRSERVVTSSSSDCSAERPMGMARRRNSWRCLVKATAADNSCCKTTADSSLAPKGNVVRCTRMFRSLDSTSCGKNSATLAAEESENWLVDRRECEAIERKELRIATKAVADGDFLASDDIAPGHHT